MMRGGRIVRRSSAGLLLFCVERLTIRGRLFLLSRLAEPLSASIDGLDVELAGQACATVDVARGKLFDKLVANSGQVELTNHPKVDDQPAPSAKAVDPGAVYAKRRNQQTASKGAQA